MMATSSLKRLARKVRITVAFGAHLDWDKQDEWQQQANGYHCTLRYQGRQYSFDYWMGPALSEEPSAECCLDSLLSDSQGGEMDFDNFCGEFGYDTDSRKAERVWNSCRKVSENLHRLLGGDYQDFLYSER